MTESLEMYLETVVVLHERLRIARITDIADELGVTKSAVHAAMRTLERGGLIAQERYGEVSPTAAGREAALALLGRRRILTAFLRDVLGLPPETAEGDACRIEHSLSEAAVLGIRKLCEERGIACMSPAPPGRRPRVTWKEVVPDRRRRAEKPGS